MRLAALGLLQLGLSAGAIALIARSAENAAAIAGAHLGLVTALWLACVCALALFAQLPVSRAAGTRGLFGLVPFALFAALFTVYTADLVALRHWGHTVSLALLVQSFGDLPHLLSLAPLRSAAVLAALGAAAWLYGRSAARLQQEVTRLFARGAAVRLCGLVLCAAGLAAASGGRVARSPALWTQEPLASLLDLQRPALERSAGDAPAALAEYPRDRAIRRAHVVLVVVDALRAANMGVYGYVRPTTPFLSRLHERGELARVDLGLSSCSQSECGVLSLLGSQGAGRARPADPKLHDVLHALRHRVVFLLSGAHLEWQGLGALFGPNVDLVRDDPTSDDANLVRALRSLPDADRPTFFYFHLMSAHWFGVQRREHQVYQPTAKRFDWLYDVKRALGRRVAGDQRQHVINRYDNAVLQADATIERLFAVLAEKGYLDDAVVAIAADHGEALGERGEDHYGHGMDLYQTLIRVPILFRDTRGGPGFGDLAFATLEDVAPTLLDRIGAAIPPAWDGRSLLDGPPRRESFHESSVPAARSRSGRDERVRAVVARAPGDAGPIYKLLRFERRDGDAYRVVREELYDLRADPDERHDLVERVDPAQRAALAARLRERFE